MAEKNPKNRDFESTNFIIFLWNWKYTLGIISLAAAILAAIFSGPAFIEPKYESTVVMFPSSTNSVSKALLGENTAASKDIMEFGDEEKAEHMLQILNSNPIRSKIINKYDLMDHYDINKDSKYRKTKLYNKYSDNITFKRTEYMAVQVKVMDTDPDTAAMIANDISKFYDTVKTNMQRQRSTKAYHMVKKEYLELKNEVEAKEDSLKELRELGVHDYESQAERINEELAKQLAKGNNAAVQRLKEKLDVLAKYGGAYVALREDLDIQREHLSEVKAKYEQAKMDTNSNLPHKFLVERAFAQEKKSYPIRWLIVVISTLAAFILAVITIIFYQSITKASQNSKTKE